MPLTTAITYGYDLGGDARWNFRELDHHEEPRLFWYINGEDFYAEATAFLKATQIDVEIVRYGNEDKGVGYILAASVDAENGPVSRPFSMATFAGVDLAEHDARLTAALKALGITPTETKFRGAHPTPVKPGWINSAYLA